MSFSGYVKIRGDRKKGVKENLENAKLANSSIVTFYFNNSFTIIIDLILMMIWQYSIC